jgi:hypothetical protein
MLCQFYSWMEHSRKDASMHCYISLILCTSTYSVKINCVVRSYLNGREKLALTKIYCNKRYMHCTVLYNDVPVYSDCSAEIV